jgi:ABC-2 type transport system ATP-binding protein
MIRLEHLSKTFKKRVALEDLSLEIRPGEIFGLLGHNGAGKSTTLGMILGQIYPTSGEAFIRGVPVQQNRQKALDKVGAIFEEPAFHDYLSGWDNLRILTSYSARLPDEELREAVRFTGLEKRIHDPVWVYSHGMRQRLALAQALLPRPDLILLDEPAEGLDPEGIFEMRKLIVRLNREQGMTVVLSSHLLAEVEQLCDRVAILNQGRMIFEGRWNELTADPSPAHRLEVDDWKKAAVILKKLRVSRPTSDTISLAPGGDMADVVSALVKGGVRIRAIEPLRRNLEDIYLKAISTAKRA